MATSDLAGLLSTAPTLSAHGAGSVGIITKETLQCLAQQRHALALTAAAAEQQANGVACLSGRQVTYAAPAAANAAAVHRYQPVMFPVPQQPSPLQRQLQQSSHMSVQTQQQLSQWQAYQGRQHVVAHVSPQQTPAGSSASDMVLAVPSISNRTLCCEGSIGQYCGTKRNLPTLEGVSKRQQIDSSCGQSSKQLGSGQHCSTMLTTTRHCSSAKAMNDSSPRSGSQAAAVVQQCPRLQDPSYAHITAAAACAHEQAVCLQWGQHGKRSPVRRRSKSQASSAHSGAADQVVSDHVPAAARYTAEAADVSVCDTPSSTDADNCVLPGEAAPQLVRQQLDQQQSGSAGTALAQLAAEQAGVSTSIEASLGALKGITADGASPADGTDGQQVVTTQFAATLPVEGDNCEKLQGFVDSSAEHIQGDDSLQQHQPPVQAGDGSSDTSVRDQGSSNVGDVEVDEQLTGQKTGSDTPIDLLDRLQQQYEACQCDQQQQQAVRQHGQPTQQQQQADQLQPETMPVAASLLVQLVTNSHLFQPCISCAPSNGPKLATVTFFHTTDWKQTYCRYCSGLIERQQLLKVLSYKGHAVVFAADITPLADVSGVQQYAYRNGCKCVYLHPRPCSKQLPHPSKPRCLIDGRALQCFSSSYCSIQCKLQAEGVLPMEATPAETPDSTAAAVAAAEADNLCSQQGMTMKTSIAAADRIHVPDQHTGSGECEDGTSSQSPKEPLTRAAESKPGVSGAVEAVHCENDDLKAWGCRRHRTHVSRRKRSVSVLEEHAANDTSFQGWDASGSRARAATAAENTNDGDKAADDSDKPVYAGAIVSSNSLSAAMEQQLPQSSGQPTVTAAHLQQQCEPGHLAVAGPATCADNSSQVPCAAVVGLSFGSKGSSGNEAQGNTSQVQQQQQQQSAVDCTFMEALRSAAMALKVRDAAIAGFTSALLQQTSEVPRVTAEGGRQSSRVATADRAADNAGTGDSVAAASCAELEVTAAGASEPHITAPPSAANQRQAEGSGQAAAQVSAGKVAATAATPEQSASDLQAPAIAVATLGNISCSNLTSELTAAAAKASPAPVVGLACLDLTPAVEGSDISARSKPAVNAAVVPATAGRPTVAPVVGIPVPGQHFGDLSTWTAATTVAAAAAARQYGWGYAAPAAQQQQYRWPLAAAPAPSAQYVGWTYPMPMAAQQYSLSGHMLSGQAVSPTAGSSAAAAAAAGSAQQYALATMANQQRQPDHTAAASSSCLPQRSTGAESSAAARAAASAAAVASQKVAWCWRWNAVNGEFEPMYDAPLAEKQQQQWPELAGMQQNRQAAKPLSQQQQQLRAAPEVYRLIGSQSCLRESSGRPERRRLQQLQSQQREEEGYDLLQLKPTARQRRQHLQQQDVMNARAVGDTESTQQQQVQDYNTEGTANTVAAAAAVPIAVEAGGSIDEVGDSVGVLVLASSSSWQLPAAQLITAAGATEEGSDDVAYSLDINPNQTLPKKHAHPGDYRRRESCKTWDAEEYELAAVTGAAELGITLAPLNQTFGDCRDPCLVSSMAAAANRAAKRAAAGLPAAALTAEIGVLVLAHDKGVSMTEAWEEWEALHGGRVVVLVHMKGGVQLTPAVPGHEWIAQRQLSTRVASEWGDVSLTEAMLSAAAEMLKRCPNLQHIALVSGQDIPVALLPLPLPAGVSMFGSFQFGHVYDAAAGRLAAAKLHQQLGLSAVEAREWGKSLTFHHTWLMLSRPLLLALLSKQAEILRVGEVLNERFMQSDAAVAADEFMLITAALKYGYGRVIIRSKLQNYVQAVRRQQKQQELHLEFEEQDEQRRSKLLAAIPGSGNVSEDDEQYASAEELFMAIQAGAAAAILKQQEAADTGCASDSGLSGPARPTRRRKQMTMQPQQGTGSNSSSSGTSMAALLPPKYPSAAALPGDGVRNGGSSMGRQVTRSVAVMMRDNAAAEEATRELAAETGDLHHGVLLDCCPTLALFHPVKTRHPHTWRNFGQVFECDLNAADEQEDGRLSLLQALALVKPNQAMFFRKIDVQRSRGIGRQSAQEHLLAVLQLLWQGKQLPESVAVLEGMGQGNA